MWTAWLLLTLNGLFFTLRLAGNTGSFPKALTREEEQDCLERMARGDTDARDELIEHNLRLVAHIVKKYYTPNGDQDDLISIGTIGLIKGVSTFRPDKNVRLATYASRCIENETLTQWHTLAEKWRPENPASTLFSYADGVDQRLFLPGGAVQLFHPGDDGVRVGLRDTLFQLVCVPGRMYYDTQSAYGIFHHGTSPVRSVCGGFVHYAAPLSPFLTPFRNLEPFP